MATRQLRGEGANWDSPDGRSPLALCSQNFGSWLGVVLMGTGSEGPWPAAEAPGCQLYHVWQQPGCPRLWLQLI